jgi:hypothetical protein
MAATEVKQNAEVSLGDFLARRARGASDARLIVDAIVGFVVAVAALLAQRPGWYLFTSAGICFLSYGAWGIADRELSERAAAAPAARWLVLARIVAAVVGFAAVILLVLGAFGVALGRIIS